MNIEEINVRLAAIAVELENATGDAFTALENEANELIAERTRLQSDLQRRQQLRGRIAVNGGIPFEPNAGGEPAARTFAPDSAEYREAYLLNLQGIELSTEQRTALSNASAVIPTHTMNQVVSYLEESTILDLIDLTYIPGNVSFPVETTNKDAAWLAMGAASTDSQDVVDSISLTAHKLIKTVEITADMAGMAIDAFEDWLIRALGAKIEKALVAAVFNGTGTNQATGICKTIETATGTFTKAKAKYSDLIAIIAALPSGPAKNARFAMPRKLFFTDVIGIEDNAGQPVCHQDVESPAKYNILGYPVVLDENVPTDNILFGDFKAYKMNIGMGPEVTCDDSVGFRSGSRVYRAMALADGKLATKDAFVRYTRATS